MMRCGTPPKRQLQREGRIHNYMRMLWGKKVLEWSETPQQALEFLIELNNRYALDGRDPNSYSGICWCLGRYDRPWGPERPIFGTVRYYELEQHSKEAAGQGLSAQVWPIGLVHPPSGSVKREHPRDCVTHLSPLDDFRRFTRNRPARSNC